MDAGERDTQVLDRVVDGEQRRSYSYGSPPMEPVLVLIFAGAPIGVILVIEGFAWIGAVLVLIAFVLSFVLWDEISESASVAAQAVRLQLDGYHLERRLDRQTRELGEAVFSGNPALAEAVNEDAHETGAELQGVAAERQRVLLAARARIERQRPSAAGFVESDGRRRE